MHPGITLVCGLALLCSAHAECAESPSEAETHLRMAEEQYQSARQDQAIASYGKAAAEFQRLGNVERFVHCFNQMGVILTRQDKYEAAKRHLDQALSAGLASLGADHLTVAATYLALGVVHSAEGQLDRSLELHHKALEIRLARLGPFDANVATSYGNIGNVHFRKGDFDRAIEAHTRALEIRAKVFDPMGPQIVESYRGLGNAYREQRQYARALEFFELALRNRSAALGSGHPDLARYYLQISEVHALAGNDVKARSYRSMAEQVRRPQE